MECKKCKRDTTIKNGRQSNGKQRYYCKNCNKSFQESYNTCSLSINTEIVKLMRSCVGVNDIASILRVSKNTVLSRKLRLGNQITRPFQNETGQEYELDEMRIVIGYKKFEAWITYAINRVTKEVIEFVVGVRTKNNIFRVTRQVLCLNSRKVYTDRLKM